MTMSIHAIQAGARTCDATKCKECIRTDALGKCGTPDKTYPTCSWLFRSFPLITWVSINSLTAQSTCGQARMISGQLLPAYSAGE